MSKYGIPYMGSKDKIAEKIISFLPSGNRLVDLFGGGFAITECAIYSHKYKQHLYNELNPLLPELIKKAKSGYYNYKRFNRMSIKCHRGTIKKKIKLSRV